MKFIDLNKQYQHLKENINLKIQQVLDRGHYILGPENEWLSQRLAERLGVRHCILATSGTVALQVALSVLDIGPGDEVITSPFTFFSAVSVILQLGATPIFVDIDPATYNIDPTKIEPAVSKKTKAILVTSLYGQCADFNAINAIANRYHIPVVEDGAQSFGALSNGKPSCALSTIGCTSFFPSKPLGCYGDGGACFTDDDELGMKMRLISNHGQQGRYHHVLLGINGRFDTIQSAVLLAKLDLFDEEIDLRQQVASWYREYLSGLVHLPKIAPENLSVYSQFTIEVDDRNTLQAELQSQGIPTAVHYTKPVYQQPAYFNHRHHSWHLPVCEYKAERVLSLPFGPYMERGEVEKIAQALSSSIEARQMIPT